jgi:arginine decarboxylase
MPFFERLLQYVDLQKDSWHTPGHSSGDSTRQSQWVSSWHSFVGQRALRADLSCSVEMLDSLLHPTGVIKEAQELAATTFGAKKTFFCLNGTSTANKVKMGSI